MPSAGVTGQPLEIDETPAEAGDVRVTSARIDRAGEVLGYAPRVDLDEGIRRQWARVLRGPPATSPSAGSWSPDPPPRGR